MRRIVIALGGNALGQDPASQLQSASGAAAAICEYMIASPDTELLIVHGNGPQVGQINTAFERAGEAMPFAECNAMSEGYIGFHLQNALRNEFARRGIPKTPCAMVTQVQVDAHDPAFADPTKPIGRMHTKEEAEAIMRKEPNLLYREDSGRGYRRVIASPLPMRILEAGAIDELSRAGFVVIACGGGGIGVIERGGYYHGCDCVIDKDRAASLLARTLGCEMLVILTAVENVYLNYNTDKQRKLESIDAAELSALRSEGHFARGSMLPKIDAALEFVNSGEGRVCAIGSLEQAAMVLAGRSGTIIHRRVSARTAEKQPERVRS